MADNEEQKSIGDLNEEARRSVLQLIAGIDHTNHSKAALHLAEAYAWLTSQRQPHGGSVDVHS